MAVKEDKRGRGVETLYIGKRLVKIRIKPRSALHEKAVPVAEELAPEIKPPAPPPKPPEAPPVEIEEGTTPVECPACKKSFGVPLDATEGACPHCNAELLFEDVLEEPKKEKRKCLSGIQFWKKKKET